MRTFIVCFCVSFSDSNSVILFSKALICVLVQRVAVVAVAMRALTSGTDHVRLRIFTCVMLFPF